MAPTSVTSSPSMTQVMPSATTTSQCQRLQGSRSSRAGMSVRNGRSVAISRAVDIVHSPQDRSQDACRVDPGQADVQALILEPEPSVIDAAEVEQGGMEIADVDHVLDGAIAEVIGGAVGQ